MVAIGKVTRLSAGSASGSRIACLKARRRRRGKRSPPSRTCSNSSAQARLPSFGERRSSCVDFRADPRDMFGERAPGVQGDPVANVGPRRRRLAGRRAPGQIHPLRRQSAGEDLLVALRLRRLEKERVQRKREPLRRKTGALIGGRAHQREGVGKDPLLVGDESIKTEAKALAVPQTTAPWRRRSQAPSPQCPRSHIRS